MAYTANIRSIFNGPLGAELLLLALLTAACTNNEYLSVQA